MAPKSKYRRTAPPTKKPAPTVAGLLGVPNDLLAHGLGLVQKLNPPAASNLAAAIQFADFAAVEFLRIAAEFNKARQDPGYVVPNPDPEEIIELKKQKDGSYK
jgi:hypothetical protein